MVAKPIVSLFPTETCFVAMVMMITVCVLVFLVGNGLYVVLIQPLSCHFIWSKPTKSTINSHLNRNPVPGKIMWSNNAGIITKKWIVDNNLANIIKPSSSWHEKNYYDDYTTDDVADFIWKEVFF